MTSTTTYATKDDALAALKGGDPKDRVAVTGQAKAEHKAQKEAKAAGTDVPESPALDALNEWTANGTRHPSKATKAEGGQAGRSVNLTDEEITTVVVPELFAAGYHTVGAMVKALRGTERGTNPKRFKRAYDKAVEQGIIDLSTIPAKAPKAEKAPAPAKAAAKRTVTPRPKAADKSAKAMGAEDEVAKRRASRKAS